MTTLGELCLLFPIDPLLAKVLLLSFIVGNFRETLKRVAFLSTTESLMNLNFESKKNYFEKKIKIGLNKKSDFECWEELFQEHQNLFHRKALKNISKIEKQLSDIVGKLPRSRVFMALLQDTVFSHLLKSLIGSIDKLKYKVKILIDVGGLKGRDDIEVICRYYPDFVKLLGLEESFREKKSNRETIYEYVSRKVQKALKKSCRRIGRVERLFREEEGIYR